MPSVMVTADFPAITADQRAKIYECLKKERWVKIENLGRDISTVWYATFEDTVTNARAIETSKSDFVKCSKPYTTPRLALMAGPNVPTTH